MKPGGGGPSSNRTVVLLRTGNLGTDVHRKDDVKLQGEDSHPQAKERGLRRN